MNMKKISALLALTLASSQASLALTPTVVSPILETVRDVSNDLLQTMFSAAATLPSDGAVHNFLATNPVALKSVTMPSGFGTPNFAGTGNGHYSLRFTPQSTNTAMGSQTGGAVNKTYMVSPVTEFGASHISHTS